MKAIDNYKSKVSYYDYHDCSLWNKKDLMHLIRKFLRNEDESVPKVKILNAMKRGALYHLWLRYKPKDLFDKLYKEKFYFKWEERFGYMEKIKEFDQSEIVEFHELINIIESSLNLTKPL